MKEINFFGLGIEVGQEQSGLKNSHEYVRRYFSFLRRQGLNLHDRGEITGEDNYGVKIHSSQQVQKFNWQPYEKAYKKIQRLLQEPEVLLNWGGDHSVALATVGAFCSQNPEGYVVWIDAHTDLNLPEYSMSGNLHGMPVSILMNLQEIASRHFPWLEAKLQPEKLIYVGVRDLDPFEKATVQKLGIETHTASDIRESGMSKIARKISEKVAHKPLHISFDIDSLSPEVAPATGVPVEDGLSLEDVKILGRALS
ncbi:MAG TPA: arginase family protein, partial [Bdellovibrio sp.]|nr:arginase family protein [Bdellovibrio sp.]